ncbi:hypothetical protein NDU88_000637 [Pleurodeles waltl]|uniref:Uncharacterized protein n=1 Tax=Pleurodeles waltl TaxID=8319 RepID=A0AAV7KRA6_PLEWA|nr:hypothetical protein NDU88_000637 [Pleurodeles waltl]
MRKTPECGSATTDGRRGHQSRTQRLRKARTCLEYQQRCRRRIANTPTTLLEKRGTAREFDGHLNNVDKKEHMKLDPEKNGKY